MRGGWRSLPGMLRARCLAASDHPALGQQSDPAGEHDPLLARHPDPGEAVPAGRGAGGGAGEPAAWGVGAVPAELRVTLSRRAALTRGYVASRCWVPSPRSGPSSRSSCAGGRSSPALLRLTPGARRSAGTGGNCCSSLAGELSPGCAVTSPVSQSLGARCWQPVRGLWDYRAGRGAAVCPAWTGRGPGSSLATGGPRGPGPPWGPPGLSWAQGLAHPDQAEVGSRGCRHRPAPQFGGGRKGPKTEHGQRGGPGCWGQAGLLSCHAWQGAGQGATAVLCFPTSAPAVGRCPAVPYAARSLLQAEPGAAARAGLR